MYSATEGFFTSVCLCFECVYVQTHRVGDGAQLRVGEDLARGVVRRVEQQHARLTGEGRLKFLLIVSPPELAILAEDRE